MKTAWSYSALLSLPILCCLIACNPSKRMARQQHRYMTRAYIDIKDSVTEAEVTMLNDTIKVLFPEDLLFEVGSAEIMPATYPLIKRFAGALNQYDKTSILINGYTDNSGSDAVNDALSKNRALDTRQLLSKYGVAENRMFTWGRGSRNPIASNETAEGRRRNRRVEFIILYSYTPNDTENTE